MADVRQKYTQVHEKPEGIGGWLILPVIGLIVTPLQGLSQLASYGDVLQNLQYLTTVQRLFVGLEILGNVAIFVLMPPYLLHLLFKKRRGFPERYITWAVAVLLFVIADLVAAKIIFSEIFAAAGIELMDSETIRTLVRAIVLVALWVPYMRVSRRVENTFVN